MKRTFTQTQLDGTPQAKRPKNRATAARQSVPRPIVHVPWSMQGTDYPPEWVQHPHFAALKHQYEHGYACFPSVVPQHLLKAAVDAIWAELHRLNAPALDMHRQNYATMRANMPTSTHGIFQNFGLGMLQEVCDAKYTDAVRDLFRLMWLQPPGTKMLASCDAVSMMLPQVTREVGWPHVDCSPQNEPILPNGTFCIQGLIVATHDLVPHPTDPGKKVVRFVRHRQAHGGLKLLPESHFKLPEVWKQLGITELPGDWYHFKDAFGENARTHEQREEIIKRLFNPDLHPNGDIKWMIMEAEPGSLLTWRSDMVHYGANPEKNANVVRSCFYICWMPAVWADAKDCKKKWKWFKDGQVTSHHPLKPRKFPSKARVWKSDDPTKLVNDRIRLKAPVLPDYTIVGAPFPTGDS